MSRSEHTKNMTPAELEALQKEVAEMPKAELTAFRAQFNPDEMGFYGEEEGEEDANN